VKLELMDPVEWENLADQIDAEFGQDVAKNLLQDRQPVTLGDGNTKRLHLVSPGWLEHLAQENERNSTFDLRFLGKELGFLVKGRLRLSLQILPELLHLTKNTLEVSGKAGEAFTYGRSIIAEGVVSLEPALTRGSRVLVVNSAGECLGIASLSVDAQKVDRLAPDRLVAKNLADVGWYIRRLG
jgi:ribosome biogenesis protein Nip4